MNLPPTKTEIVKILIVDDQAEARQMTKLFLGDSTFEFKECADGADAVECFERIHPDWILMDWKMNGMSGLEATRQIVAAHPEARILMLTQYDDAEMRRAAAEAGARGYVLKENLFSLGAFLGV